MAQPTVKGSLQLTIDEAELEAAVVFTPSKDGADWSQETLSRMFLDNKINQVNAKACEELIKDFGRSKSPVSKIVLKGIPPEQPQTESVGWEPLEIPDTFKTFSSEAENAPSPDLFRIRTEKIKKERKVKKPSPIPFMPPKEEIVVEYETREIKERVVLSSPVTGLGYAKAGEKIGTVTPQKQGKPGKTIFGKPIMVKQLENAQILLGPGVKREKNDLFALQSGFVRQGALWADIIPFSGHEWDVKDSDDGRGVELSFKAGDKRLPLPHAAEMIQKAVELGAKPETLINAETLAKTIAESAASGAELHAFKLCGDQDGLVRLDIAGDKSSATITIRKPSGNGKPVDWKAVGEILKTCSSYKGANVAKIKADIIAFRDGNDPALETYELAKGIPPTRGKGREFATCMEFPGDDKAQELRQRLLSCPGAFVGMDSLGEFQVADAEKIGFVKKDQEVAKLSKPEPGKPGVDIFGQPIPALPGNDCIVRALENVRISQGTVISDVSGLVMYHKTEDKHLIRAVPYRDAEILVQIAPDSMTAWLTLSKEAGAGKPLSTESVTEALKGKGVVHGIDTQTVLASVRTASRGETVLKAVAARGTPGIPDGGFSAVSKVELKPRPEGTGFTCAVAKDQIVAVISKTASGGKQGTNVLGAAVPPPQSTTEGGMPGHDASIAETAAPDGTVTFSAAVQGVLTVSGNRYSIVSQYRVPSDVGQGSGNVKFQGSILVEGSVKSGFMVVSGGDIFVRGLVEGAILSGEGRVVAAQGIKGVGKAAVSSKKTIEAAFAEGATLLAVEGVKIKDACSQCSVKTNGKLALMSEKGTLVGGLTRARNGISVQDLGSPRRVKTEVSFGQDYLIQDMIETERREMDKIKPALVDCDKKLKQLHDAGQSVEELGQHKAKLMKLMEKRSLRLFTLLEKFEEHHPSAIDIRGTVHPGVILESHNRIYEVKQARSRVRFEFDRTNGKITEKPL